MPSRTGAYSPVASELHRLSLLIDKVVSENGGRLSVTRDTAALLKAAGTLIEGLRHKLSTLEEEGR